MRSDAAASPEPSPARGSGEPVGPAPKPSRFERLLLVLDLVGVFVFALEGAMAALGGDFDALGVLVLSFATALGGGLVRDLLIGASPPNAIKDWRYPAVAFAGGAVVLFAHPFVRQVPPWLLIGLDAGGLALCAVAGAEKALAFGINPLLAVMMGAITGVGGGTIRDLLLARSPWVLHSDVYATAAMVGAVVVVIGRRVRVRPGHAALAGAVACFALRVVAVWQHWNLPKLR